MKRRQKISWKCRLQIIGMQDFWEILFVSRR